MPHSMGLDLNSLSYFWLILDEQLTVLQCSEYFADKVSLNLTPDKSFEFLSPSWTGSEDFKVVGRGKIIQLKCLANDLKFRINFHALGDKFLLQGWPALSDIDEVKKFGLAQYMKHPCCQLTDLLIVKDAIKKTQDSIRKLEVEKYIQKLAESEKIAQHHSKLASIGEISAGIAHEINNPLAISMAYNDRLKMILTKENYPNQKVFECIEKQRAAEIRIRNIVHGLRNFARVDSGEPAKVLLNPIVEQTLLMMDEILKKDDIHLQLDLQNLPIAVFGVEGEIEQVLVNLLTNSKHALKNITDKKIMIKTWAADDKVFLEVADNGAGIPKEIQKKIFEPFFTTKEAGVGTGLGLAILFKIVDKMKGAVEVRSETDQGTAFVLSFPANL